MLTNVMRSGQMCTQTHSGVGNVGVISVLFSAVNLGG